MGFHCVFIAAIVVFGISIVGQSFGELLVLRQHQKLTCLSEDDDSAFIWNDVYATGETLDFQPDKSTQKTDPPCAIWNSTECHAHWENMTGWERVGSQFKPMAPVLDFRWEDFKEFTGKGHINYSKYQNVGTVSGSSGSVAFSARGQTNLHILLCENENPTAGPCFWIILGGWEGKTSVMRFCGSGGPPDEQAPRRDKCIENDRKEHGQRGILDPYEWRTFRLIWSSNEKKIQVIRDTNHDKEPILQRAVEKVWPDVSHMSIRLDATSRVRFHFYEYLLTEKKDSVLYSEEFYHYEEHFCFKLLLGLCAECKLSVKLADNSGRGFEIEDISGEQSSAYNGTLIWRSVELSKNLTDYDHKLERPFRLEIRTILTKDEASGQWAIDNFRMCKPGGQRRESTIFFPQNPTEVGCQKLSYNESTVIRPMSASKINANTNESQQFIDELVKDCGSSCKNFSKNSLLCNAIGCTCNRGFEGTDCSETCTDGYYGYNCGRKCETCIFGFCDKITGLCATSCRTNTLLPPLCKTEIERPTVAEITDTTAVIVQKIELEKTVDARVEVTIQVGSRPDLWMNFTAKQEGSGTPLSYKSDMSNLTQDTVYTYRTIVSVILAKGTIPVTSPEMNFTTTCFMQPNFTVTPGKTSLTVDLENKKICLHDRGPQYLVLVYEPVKNITINQPKARFKAVYNDLTPYTEYNVTISNMRINKTVFDRKYRTLEAAPSEVENLKATSITENKTTLRWDPPLQRNGLIRYYNVSLTGKLIACKKGENGELHYVPSKTVNETILTISGLHPYAVYTATVVAHTIEPGEPRVVEFRTLETEIPQSKFSNFKLGNKNKTLCWEKPADCTTVTGRTNVGRLFVENIDNLTAKIVHEQTKSNCIDLKGKTALSTYTRYTVRLHVARDYNRPINLTYYQELTWRTPPSKPPPVKELEIHDADIETNTISLRWIPPYPANGEIESYKVSIKQRGKFISNKTFEVLEERLKCEFEADYVCLKNFTINEDIEEDNTYRIEVRAINKEVSEPGVPNGLDITPEIYNKKPSDPQNLTSMPQNSGIVKLNWARDRFSLTKITDFHIKVNQTSTKLLSNKIHEVSMKHSAGINQTEYSVELHLMTSTDYEVSIVAVNRLNFTSKASNIAISVPGSIAYEQGANVTIKQVGNFIEVLAPEVVNATRNTSVNVTVHGLMTCRAVNSPKSLPPTKRKEWLAAVYKLEENKPKSLTIGHIHNHGVQFNCTFDMGKTYYVVLTATDLYSGTMTSLESAPITLQVPVPPPKSNLTWLIIFPTKTFEVLEERLKCEFGADYVCLKNFTIDKYIEENKIYKIKKMEFNTTRNVRPEPAESKSIFEVGIKLEPNTRYKLRTDIGQWSRQANSNEIFSTTTCMGQHRFQVLPGENTLTVTPLSRDTMCGDLENPIKSVTVSQRTGEKILCQHVIQWGSYICSQLSPHTEYEIQIVASDSTSWMVKFWTLESAPEKPGILIPSLKGNGIVELTWTYPAFNKTSVELFRIHAVRLESKLQAIAIPGTTERDYPVTEQKLSYSIDLELLTSTSYEVSVVAVNQHNVQSAESGREIWVPAGVAFASGKGLEVKQSGTLIELEVPRVINATMNTTVSIVIKELSVHTQNQSQTSSTFANKPEWVATEYKVKDSEPKHLMIDGNHKGGVASNFSLKIGGTYMILAIVKDLYSNSSAKLPPITITLTDVEPNLIWLIIFPIIAICLLALFIWHLKRKRVPKQPRQPSYVEPIPISLELKGTDNNSTHLNTQELRPSIPRRPTYLEIIPPSPTTTPIIDWPAPDITTSSPEPEATEDRSSDHVYTVPNEPDFCCVSMENFAEYAKSAATSRRLHSQFMILNRILPSSPSEYGRLPENVPKNRDGNMPACDDSRVVLEKIPGDPHSDYINASYIKGYERERAYIAAQGPKPETVNDFWRMVWQEKVRVICMLTNVIEGGETKCEKYWPDVKTGVKYGDFHVSNTDNQVYADYTFRTFELSYKRNTRKVTHLHYTGWPDLGVPTYPRSLVDYLRKLEQTPDGNSPVVVHCSTGDDRTGTIILCAICLRQALAEKLIDVMAVTARMRDTRANMVGTLQQYVLAHVIITESLTSWPTQIPCADVLSNRMNKLRIKLPSDMKRLNDTTWQLQALQFSASANLPTAKHSINDENPEHVQDRPEVIYDDVCEGERNQINAVSVDGVKTKKQYLACWLPSPFTLPKFWEFVIERDIKLIIILQCSDPRDPTCCDIIPSESIAVPSLEIEVENRTDRDTGEFFTNEKLRLTETSEANARSQSLTVLTCKRWGCGTIQKPPPPEALISLWRASEKIPRKEGQALVLCHDGVTGCGLYLAMSFLLERMAVERECDVISAIRAVRRSNPKFVQLTEQCEYLYDAAQAYAEYFQCYANFS